MLVQKKSDLQLLLIWSVQREEELDYWVSLGNYVYSIGIYPIYLLPDSAPKQASVIQELGFRVITYDKSFSKDKIDNWSYGKVLYVFLDSVLSIKTIQKQFVWLRPTQFVQVDILGKRNKLNWIIPHKRIVALPEVVKQKQDIWVPIQPKQKYVSEEISIDEKRKLSLDPQFSLVKIHFGEPYCKFKNFKSSSTIRKIEPVIMVIESFLEQIKNMSKKIFVVIERQNDCKEEIYELLLTRLYRFIDKQFVIFPWEERINDSSIDVIWFFGTDKHNLYVNFVTYSSIGIPLIASNEESNTFWAAAGFAEETNPIEMSIRWVQKTNDLLENCSWEKRRVRIQNFWERYGKEQQGMRLLNWLECQPKP